MSFLNQYLSLMATRSAKGNAISDEGSHQACRINYGRVNILPNSSKFSKLAPSAPKDESTPSVSENICNEDEKARDIEEMRLSSPLATSSNV